VTEITYRARIGYGKLGRSMTMDPKKYGPQGDAEAPQLLRRLASRNPDVEWVVIGKHTTVPDFDFWPSNVRFVWPNGIPRAHVLAKGEDVLCAFCKTIKSNTDVAAYCCDKGAQVVEVERSIVTMAYTELDGMIVHLGQHGTSNWPIPPSKGRWGDVLTKPQAVSRNYSEFLTRSLNALNERTSGNTPVTYICVDPRNYPKARDIKWPTGMNDILSQHSYTRTSLHERFGDTRDPASLGFDWCRWEPNTDNQKWRAQNKFRQADLELMILADDWETWGDRPYEERASLGVATTSMFVDRDEWRRSWLTKTYVMDQFPDAQVFGRWDDKCLETDATTFEVQTNSVAQFPDLLASWRCTVSLPAGTRSSDGINWSVAKPYQAFAARTVCFFIGQVDQQGWVLPTFERTTLSHEVGPGLWSIRDDWTQDELTLASWLRVQDPGDLKKRVDAVNTSRDTYDWLQGTQRALLARRWGQGYLESTIERQLGIR
jgi:hypothetical protein